MKVYLDTNMLYFLLLKNNEDISPAVSSILSDYQTVLCTSSVCVQELIHLCHIGKVPVGKKKSVLKNAHDVLTWLNDMNIEIVAVTEKLLLYFEMGNTALADTYILSIRLGRKKKTDMKVIHIGLFFVIHPKCSNFK